MKADETRILTEAAAWVEWAGGPATRDEEALAFERWMAESEAHREAFADLAALWRSDALGEAVSEMARTEPVKRRRDLPWNLLVPVGMAAALAVCVGVFAPLGDYRTIETARDESRTVVLADGSTVRLNGAARLQVSQGLLGRSVSLERGEAYFDVRHDGRGFSVATAEGEVRVLGTAFNVDRLASGRTEVSVYRGAVRFGPWLRPTLDLRPGDRVTLENGRLNRTPGAAAGRQPDWFDGWFDAGDASLGQLVEEADRFSPKPIVIDAPASRIRVSGRFNVGRSKDVLELIEAAYGVDVIEERDRILISRHDPR